MKHVCRICLKVINDLNFVVLKTDEPSQIKMQLSFCVPEIVVDLVKDPVFCKSCGRALHSAYNFKNLCLSTEEHIKNLKISHSKSINIMDSLYDLLQSTNGVSEDNGEFKNTREGLVIKPNTDISLSDKDLANGQNLNYETQRSVTVPIDSFNNIVNANNVTSNDLNKLFKQTSVDELDSLSDDALWNTSVQPLAYEEEVKSEYKDITIDEDFSQPKMEPSWSYEGYKDASLEDTKSGDCTTDSENNRVSVQTDTVIQDCFVKLATLSNNILHNNVNKSNYKGDYNFRSSQKTNLKQHLKIHTGEKPFICNVCDHRFARKTHLKEHLRIHTGEKPFACTVCDYRSAVQSHLRRHLRIHTGEKPFVCNVCTFSFACNSNLQRHLKRHTGEKSFICNVCTCRFACKSSLQRHLKRHTGEKPFICNVCDYHSAQKWCLKIHLGMHTGEKPFACTVCDYRSVQKSDLQKHLRIHTGEKPFVCNVCDYRSVLQSGLQRHLRIHTSEKPFTCNVCTFRSAQKSHLQQHLRIHTGERPFACNLCSFRSAYKSSLKAHLQMHTGEKPFACTVCDYRSTVQSDLRKHLNIHTGEKPYSCDLCTFHSTHKSNLRRHLRIHAIEKT